MSLTVSWLPSRSDMNAARIVELSSLGISDVDQLTRPGTPAATELPALPGLPLTPLAQRHLGHVDRLRGQVLDRIPALGHPRLGPQLGPGGQTGDLRLLLRLGHEPEREE